MRLLNASLRGTWHRAIAHYLESIEISSVISLCAVAVHLQLVGFQNTARPGWACFIKDDSKSAESLPSKYSLKTSACLVERGFGVGDDWWLQAMLTRWFMKRKST